MINLIKNCDRLIALIYIYFRAVKVSALIYAINVAAINALKYFNATFQHEHVTLLVPHSDTPTTTSSSSLPFLLHHWPANKPANESLLSHTAPPHWSRTVTCPTPTCSLTLRTSQYLFNHFIGKSYRPEPLWKHSSVCSFVFKKNTIQQLSKIHAVWSDYSLIYKISFLEEKQTFNRD